MKDQRSEVSRRRAEAALWLPGSGGRTGWGAPIGHERSLREREILVARKGTKGDYRCQSSTIATGLTQPALARLILTGKQQTVNPNGRPMDERFAIFSMWQ